MPRRRLDWKISRRYRKHEFGVFSVRRHDAVHPETGKSHRFTVLHTRDWVNIIALTADEEVVFVRQFRHGIERQSLEIPGGAVDPGERARTAAQRELVEETGFTAPRWVELGRVDPNPAIQSNVCHTFLALDAEQSAQARPDPGEVLTVELVDLGDVAGLIERGRIRHSLVVAAFGHLLVKAGGWRRPRRPRKR